jgi:hypothetical protein
MCMKYGRPVIGQGGSSPCGVLISLIPDYQVAAVL